MALHIIDGLHLASISLYGVYPSVNSLMSEPFQLFARFSPSDTSIHFHSAKSLLHARQLQITSGLLGIKATSGDFTVNSINSASEICIMKTTI